MFPKKVLASKPVAALHLESGVSPNNVYNMRLIFLKHLLGKNEGDAVLKLYQQMVKY